MNPSLEKSYQNCLSLARKHYENFPVASLLIPKRKHIAAVYAFARIADDISDESHFNCETRLEMLNEYLCNFLDKKDDPRYPHFLAVFDTIEKNKLSLDNFIKLIEAFIQDNQKFYYDNWDELLDYCKKSANPIGRIILELFSIREENILNLSDKICSALQLTNFWQDLKIDLTRNRCYIPLELLRANGIEIKQIKMNNLNIDSLLCDVISECVIFTERLFDEGKKILNYLSGLFKFEIKLSILGGEEILNKIKALNYNTIQTRPVLNKLDWLKIFIRSFNG